MEQHNKLKNKSKKKETDKKLKAFIKQGGRKGAKKDFLTLLKRAIQFSG
ncbi:MAG: hypothetical protein HYV37_03405 [Candidatus Levyibacteriota bacterium]|nr:MAG: hypothetical protein HYV37_03405 [Candidatus Levybacteria bacterium]